MDENNNSNEYKNDKNINITEEEYKKFHNKIYRFEKCSKNI